MEQIRLPWKLSDQQKAYFQKQHIDFWFLPWKGIGLSSLPSPVITGLGMRISSPIHSFWREVDISCLFGLYIFKSCGLFPPILPLLRMKNIAKLQISSAINIKCVSHSSLWKACVTCHRWYIPRDEVCDIMRLYITGIFFPTIYASIQALNMKRLVIRSSSNWRYPGCTGHIKESFINPHFILLNRKFHS